MDGPELMGRRFTRLKRWAAAQSRRRLWAALGVMALLNLATAVYLLATHPFIPFKPICDEDMGPATFAGGLRTLDGVQKREFVRAITDTFHRFGVDFLSDFPVVYVTFGDWFEEEYLWNMTNKAVRRIIEQRVGRPFDEVPKSLYAKPHPDIEGSYYAESACETMEPIVITPENVKPFFFLDSDPFWKERLKGVAVNPEEK